MSRAPLCTSSASSWLSPPRRGTAWWWPLSTCSGWPRSATSTPPQKASSSAPSCRFVTTFTGDYLVFLYCKCNILYIRKITVTQPLPSPYLALHQLHCCSGVDTAQAQCTADGSFLCCVLADRPMLNCPCVFDTCHYHLPAPSNLLDHLLSRCLCCAWWQSTYCVCFRWRSGCTTRGPAANPWRGTRHMGMSWLSRSCASCRTPTAKQPSE